MCGACGLCVCVWRVCGGGAGGVWQPGAVCYARLGGPGRRRRGLLRRVPMAGGACLGVRAHAGVVALWHVLPCWRDGACRVRRPAAPCIPLLPPAATTHCSLQSRHAPQPCLREVVPVGSRQGQQVDLHRRWETRGERAANTAPPRHTGRGHRPARAADTGAAAQRSAAERPRAALAVNSGTWQAAMAGRQGGRVTRLRSTPCSSKMRQNWLRTTCWLGGRAGAELA